MAQDRTHATGELLAGLSAAVFAVVDTLDQKGVIELSDYRARLVGLWDQMPEEDAASGIGFFFARMIDLLNTAIDQRANQT